MVRRHPRRLSTAVAAFLLCAGGGAFAVASLGPDASELPVETVIEAIDTLPVDAQALALDTHSFNLFRTDLTRSSDTPESLLQRLGIADADAAAFLRRDANVRQVLWGRAGRNVKAEASDTHSLVGLSARWSADDGSFKRLVVEKGSAGFISRIEQDVLTTSARLASGTIQSSLFAAADEVRLPDSVATQLAEIFSGDIDFHRALRRGDRFSVVYETLEADGEPLRAGRVLSAEFVNNGKTFQAMWFQEPGTKGGYYTLNGDSLQRAFLASPMAFSRITSGFKMRFHPILKTWRAHNGVDYAAPTGTPVRTVGDGVVEFAGVQNGFGNVVFVKHRGGNTTVYAHLSKINVRRGQNVAQGDNIGAVGMTGWATGPHLHFEFRVNGEVRDPLTVARQAETVPLSTASRPAFERLAAGYRVQLGAAAIMQQASAQ
ncbi:MAG: M23 family metallopeptidase [Burkholderiales bacterium]|nr:M23 family metallopeptidase [Burkholderiales bacterium]